MCTCVQNPFICNYFSETHPFLFTVVSPLLLLRPRVRAEESNATDSLFPRKSIAYHTLLQYCTEKSISRGCFQHVVFSIPPQSALELLTELQVYWKETTSPRGLTVQTPTQPGCSAPGTASAEPAPRQAPAKGYTSHTSPVGKYTFLEVPLQSQEAWK